MRNRVIRVVPERVIGQSGRDWSLRVTVAALTPGRCKKVVIDNLACDNIDAGYLINTRNDYQT